MKSDLISSRWQAQGAALPSSMAEWELLLAQARTTRLSARLALQFAGNAGVPPRVGQHLDNALRLAEALQANVRHELRQVAHALRPLGMPVVLLKGAAYVAAELPPAAGRFFSDIDLLVPRDRLRDVEDELFVAGWLPEKLKPYDDRYYRQWMHELPPLHHIQRNSYLDVHHTLAPPTSRFVIDAADMLARSVPVVIQGIPEDAALRVLAPTDMVLHSALHLMQEGEFHAGLRDLLDIRDLLLHFGQASGFWPALGSRAQALGLQGVLAHVLAQVERLFGVRPPPGWTPSARPGRLVQLLLPSVLTPSGPAREDMLTRFAKLLMYVRSHWLRMPWYQIVPHIVRKAWARAAERNAGRST